MGCGSSSAAMSSYPGNRRVAQPAYTPNSNEYKRIDAHTAVAQAHFVTCPGGNALRLMSGARDENYMHPMEKVGATGGAASTYISGERTERFIVCIFFHTVYFLITHCFVSLRYYYYSYITTRCSFWRCHTCQGTRWTT